MAKVSEDNKRHFHWSNKVSNEVEDHHQQCHTDAKQKLPSSQSQKLPPRKKLQAATLAGVRSVLTAVKNRMDPTTYGVGPGPRVVVGTFFGSRGGHVRFALQKDPGSQPDLLVELQTPINGLVREMSSGLVRIALECDRGGEKANPRRLLEEPVWRTYCNGKKRGFAVKRECGEKERRVLKAVEPISTGAGVLPAERAAEDGGGEGEGEVMYVRAKFERVMGSRDSEAFYMMNPDSGAPELSIYLLRV